MARDKRGVSALLLSRELGLRYETAWLMAHKLRHALTERPEFPLEGLVEVDESYYGGRGKPESRGRGLANPNKSLLVMAVEKRPVGPGKGIKASGFVAGHARLAILPAANARELGGFVRAAVRPESRLVSDDFKGYLGLQGDYRHHPVVQGEGKNAERLMPIVHVLFSNVKTWLNGTYHGVSAKHLPRYAREWNYRFNRRTRIRWPTSARRRPTDHHLSADDQRSATRRRATPANGTTASTGARASPRWPTSCSSAPSPNRPSPIGR